jgi:hypothetical protein
VVAGAVTAAASYIPLRDDGARWQAVRLSGNPLITPNSDPGIGTNINGPSVIRVPAWVRRPLGRYYMYFADHNGRYIRLAYSDKASGPFTVYPPGVLPLSSSYFTDHIASPEAVVVPQSQEIRLYYHGLSTGERAQHTRVAVSKDGIAYCALEEPVGRGSAYWRLFRHEGWWTAIAMPGVMLRSRDGVSRFEQGPRLVPASERMVHCGLMLEGKTLHLFYTRAGDIPERIVQAQVQLAGDWEQWRCSAAHELLKPELAWEGAGLPAEAGRIGAVDHPINALRDPAVLRDQNRILLYYAVAGESGIAAAELRRERQA